jgi:mRNA interferase HicA
VTYGEFKRWLIKQGCSFEQAKGSHQIVRYGSRSSIFPNHGKKECPKGTEMGIKKDLGLK